MSRLPSSIPCRATGNHLSAQNDEPGLDVFPELVELNALECAKLREAQHTDDWHRRNDRRALELQVQHLDAIRRAGW